MATAAEIARANVNAWRDSQCSWGEALDNALETACEYGVDQGAVGYEFRLLAGPEPKENPVEG